MSFQFMRTADDQRKLRDVRRKVIEGRKYLIGQNMQGKDFCCVPVPGTPGIDWRGSATGEQRTVLVRWIIENMPRPWEYL